MTESNLGRNGSRGPGGCFSTAWSSGLRSLFPYTPIGPSTQDQQCAGPSHITHWLGKCITAFLVAQSSEAVSLNWGSLFPNDSSLNQGNIKLACHKHRSLSVEPSQNISRVVSLGLKVGLLTEPTSDYFLPGFAIIQTLPNSPFTQEPCECRLGPSVS